MAEAMRKCGNVTLDASDKADDAKYSFPKGGHKQKIQFVPWILQISMCNKWCKKGAYWRNWRSPKANVS